MEFAHLLKSWVFIAIGVLIASHTAGGISYESVESLIVAVLLLSLCNVFLKPLLMLFSLPFIILTFGIGIWLINAALFLLVGQIVGGFDVASFWSALWGALVVSIVGGVANVLFAPPGQRRFYMRVDRTGPDRTGPPPSGIGGGRSGPKKRVDKDDDDVIDV